MKLVPAILLAVFTFVAVWGIMDLGPATVMAVAKGAGPLALLPAGIGFVIDVLTFLFLAKKAVGRGRAAPTA